MIPLPFNLPVSLFTLCFSTSRIAIVLFEYRYPRTFGTELIPPTSSRIRRHSPGRISPLKACESTKPTGVYTALSVNLR